MNRPASAALTGASHALPAPMDQQQLWDGFFRDHYADARLARKVWEHSAITTRRGVVDPTTEDISGWGTAARMQRFLAEALPLGKEASAARSPTPAWRRDVGPVHRRVLHRVRHAGPGHLLARDLGMTTACSGCTSGTWAATRRCPGLGATATTSPPAAAAVMLCLELTSLHVQPRPRRAAAAADAGGPAADGGARAVQRRAAAVVLEPAGRRRRAGGRRRGRPHRRRDRRPHDVGRAPTSGFKMGLSPAVPDVLARHARPVVEELLAGTGWAVADVDGWAIHPGGPQDRRGRGRGPGAGRGAARARRTTCCATSATAPARLCCWCWRGSAQTVDGAARRDGRGDGLRPGLTPLHGPARRR
jgi:predicted naringenin-chalcone synthase